MKKLRTKEGLGVSNGAVVRKVNEDAASNGNYRRAANARLQRVQVCVAVMESRSPYQYYRSGFRAGLLQTRLPRAGIEGDRSFEGAISRRRNAISGENNYNPSTKQNEHRTRCPSGPNNELCTCHKTNRREHLCALIGDRLLRVRRTEICHSCKRPYDQNRRKHNGFELKI